MSARDIPRCCRTCSEYNACVIENPQKPCGHKANSDECASWRMSKFCPAVHCKRRKRLVVHRDQERMF